MKTLGYKVITKISLAAPLFWIIAVGVQGQVPTISNLSPTMGIAGSSVTIGGSNFGASQGSSTVSFNGTTASVTTWSDSSIATTVPFGATSGAVTVYVGGVASNGVSFTVLASPSITGLSPTLGTVGEAVTITGSGFGATQGTSTVSATGVAATIFSWSPVAIVAVVPAGASSGSFSVTVDGQTAYSPSFTVTTIPFGWSDADVGTVGIAGTSSYANGIFTITGAGGGTFTTTTDGLHFVYQALSGDGALVARVTGIQGNSSSEAGLMIRETLSSGATNAFVFDYGNNTSGTATMSERTATGASSGYQYGPSTKPPTWMKLIRSGNAFTAYQSTDGVNWAQVGSTQTIVMAQNAYIGLGVSSRSTSTASTATFDNVSINFAATPAPVITSCSATTGSVGSQINILGNNFGASQIGSAVFLNDAPVTINAWSNTSITVTIPSGATSGLMIVSVAPAMNDSNAFVFTVTAQPLPIPWLDADVGTTGFVGSATYSNGVLTIKGAGNGTLSTRVGAIHKSSQLCRPCLADLLLSA